MARPRWRRGGREERESVDASSRSERIRRGVFILPALVTLCNFGCGFVSIFYAVEGRYVAAAYLIIFAMIADALDGAVARATRTESRFGAELDSLADIVSFGCAPALLIYERFGLSAHPFWIFPLFFGIAGALRLARYNAVDASSESKDFRGTPIPAPAGVVVGLVLALEKENTDLDRLLVTIIVFLLSYLMICNIRYPSFKTILQPEQPHPFRTLVILLLVIVLLMTHFVGTWLILAAVYYASGPFLGLKGKLRRRSTEEGALKPASTAGPAAGFTTGAPGPGGPGASG